MATIERVQDDISVIYEKFRSLIRDARRLVDAIEAYGDRNCDFEIHIHQPDRLSLHMDRDSGNILGAEHLSLNVRGDHVYAYVLSSVTMPHLGQFVEHRIPIDKWPPDERVQEWLASCGGESK